MVPSNFEHHQQRPALRHIDPTYNPLTTAGYLMSGRTAPSWSTPSWTQRTVIYPLPTRHSRIYRKSNAERLRVNVKYIMVVALFILPLLWWIKQTWWKCNKGVMFSNKLNLKEKQISFLSCNCSLREVWDTYISQIHVID